MKQFFSFLFLLAWAAAGFAKPISPETARQVASYFYTVKASQQNHYKKDAEMVLAYTSSSKAVNAASLTTPVNYFYVFNAGNKNGFVIVSADDIVTPILGYANEGEISQENMPKNVAKWLEGYKSDIRYAIENKFEATETVQREWDNYLNERNHGKRETNAVAPLMKTKWNQSPFYNDLCPKEGNKKAVTGCVATAMAQIMKYWNYPSQGTGFHSYNHEKFGTVSANFGNTKYDWANMPNEVNNSNNAVATLMFHCGVSVDMNYGIEVSGAYVINDYTPVEHCSEFALEKYFGYHTDLRGVMRKNYTNAQWDQMLRTELDAGRPILYAGFGTGGGHCFVADGYDNNNMFHFNWGWGGYYDGYFVSTALDPGGVGTGGGTGGYNSEQQAVIGIKPANGGGGGGGGNTTALQLYDNVTVSKSTAYYIEGFTVHTDILNNGTTDFTGDYCAAIFDNTGTFVDFIETKTNVTLPGGYHYTNGIEFTTTGLLSALPGEYTVGVFCKPTGGNWMLIDKGNFNNYAQISIINPNDIELYSSMLVTPGASSLVKGQPASVKVDLANFGTMDYSGTFDISLYNLDGTFAATIETKTNISLCSNCHFQSPLTFTTNNLNVEPGTYLLAVLHQPTGGSWQIAGSTQYLNPIKVIVKSADLAPDNYENNNTANTAYNAQVTFNSNNGSFRSTGSSIHTGADYDYYKINLPNGYDYTLSARVHDAENSTNGTYTNDVLFSYSKDGNSWSDAYDVAVPSNITVKGGGVVYFMVAPYFQGVTGTYLLDVNIQRTANNNTGIEEKPENTLFSISPNPAKNYLQLAFNANSSQVRSLRVVDIAGREIMINTNLQVKDNKTSLNVENLTDGVYFIVVETDKGTWKDKFIKVR